MCGSFVTYCAYVRPLEHRFFFPLLIIILKKKRFGIFLPRLATKMCEAFPWKRGYRQEMTRGKRNEIKRDEVWVGGGSVSRPD